MVWGRLRALMARLQAEKRACGRPEATATPTVHTLRLRPAVIGSAGGFDMFAPSRHDVSTRKGTGP